MGRFISTNSAGGESACILGNSTATVCGAFCGDGRNICNVGACSSSGIGCVWQPIEVCCCWINSTICGYKCFLYNFSCWSMIKIEFNGMARCEYDSCFKILADSTNCDLISNPNTNQYYHRYAVYCGFSAKNECDVVCIPTNCMVTNCCTARTGPMVVCLFPVSHGYNSGACTAHIGGRWEFTGHASSDNACSSGWWAPSCIASPGQICYPLCCVTNCTGMNFNRLRIANGCCFWSVCQAITGASVAGAYYGLWGMPRQTVGLVPPV